MCLTFHTYYTFLRTIFILDLEGDASKAPRRKRKKARSDEDNEPAVHKKRHKKKRHSPPKRSERANEGEPASSMADHFKTIDGVVYDFRCHFCKILPRDGKANRSELYR